MGESHDRFRYDEHPLSLIREPAAYLYLADRGLPRECSLFFPADARSHIVEAVTSSSSVMTALVATVRTGVDVATGEVVIMSLDVKSGIGHVNASPEAFDRCISEVDRRSYGDDETSSEELEAISAELGRALFAIDGSIFYEDPGFWSGRSFIHCRTTVEGMPSGLFRTARRPTDGGSWKMSRYSLLHRYGDGEDLEDAADEAILACLHELDVNEDETEHRDIWIADNESDWSLGAFAGDRGLVVIEDSSPGGQPVHRTGVSRADAFELFRRFANGELDDIRSEPWQPGYGSSVEGR